MTTKIVHVLTINQLSLAEYLIKQLFEFTMQIM